MQSVPLGSVWASKTIHEKLVECVAVDLGINSLDALSIGEMFKGAKSYKKYELKLARLQYLLRQQERHVCYAL
jgi:putative transposase